MFKFLQIVIKNNKRHHEAEVDHQPAGLHFLVIYLTSQLTKIICRSYDKNEDYLEILKQVHVEQQILHCLKNIF